jgi:diaminopimelate decarboxylase
MNVNDGKYEIQHIRIEDLCNKYGDPLYLYDGNKILSQFRKLSQALQVQRFQINYACKALSNLSVLKLLQREGAGLDAVSIGEIKLGLLAGFHPGKIIFTPSAISNTELEEAIAIGVMINVDNLDTLEYIGHNHPNYPICIRINPHILAGGNSKISVGHIDSKFGISIHQVPLIKRIVDTLGIHVKGVHMHTGSDILDINVFLQAAEILFNVAREFPHIDFIDFGSGFKVQYKQDDYCTDIEHLGKEISQRFNTFCEELGRPLELIFEPGKFLVSESGYFLVRTNSIKHTTSTVFACVDSGFNHLIRPMFYGGHHEILNISNPSGPLKIYSVVGYICETDTFAWNRSIHEIRKGDLLAIKNAGAYCFTMASQYNARPRPAEVLIYNGKDYLVRKRETFEDLIRGVTEIEFKD